MTQPPPAKPPIQARKMWLGIGIGLFAHLLTVLLAWMFALVNPAPEEPALTFLVVGLIAQGVLMIAAIVVGTVLTIKGDGGVGAGLIIGWAVGLIITPILGFGVCVALADSSGGMFG